MVVPAMACLPCNLWPLRRSCQFHPPPIGTLTTQQLHLQGVASITAVQGAQIHMRERDVYDLRGAGEEQGWCTRYPKTELTEGKGNVKHKLVDGGNRVVL